MAREIRRLSAGRFQSLSMPVTSLERSLNSWPRLTAAQDRECLVQQHVQLTQPVAALLPHGWHMTSEHRTHSGTLVMVLEKQIGLSRPHQYCKTTNSHSLA
jgi:hypothetical protein